MAEFRSDHRAYGGFDRNFEIVSYNGQMNNYNSRCHEHGPTTAASQPNRSSRGVSTASKNSSTKSCSATPWSFNDPEMKRRRRVIKYKCYAVEGKVKSSVCRGFRWFRNKCSEIVHGY
ncbi:hypothetical protein C5167_015131 [Papaver somniferum]|uniref:DUF3511 domain-containing protein n=1 Tax=Papaver somniferum TaxID=3469 RepID=A0A4Y7J971_PAPSO|nr:hypothetical protein C5167_015131 [Papaver somniferum]